jgi:phage tail sheath protein FI
MPVTPTYPGVYIEELPSGVRTIVGVSTSVAAFVDGFTRGPLDKAVQIFNFGGFEREFGGLRSTSEASYAIQQFFLNGGSEAWVVRVTESASPAAASTGTADDEAGVLAMSLGAGRMVGGVSVEDPGVWGDNLRVDIDYASKDPVNLFNIAVSEVDSAGRVVRSESFNNLSEAAGVNNARSKVNENSKLVQITADLAGTPAQTGTTSGPGLITATDGDALSIDHGTGASGFNVPIAGGPLNSTDHLPQIADALERAIRAIDSTDPFLAGATVDAVGGRLLVRVGRGASGWESKTLVFAGADVAAWNLDGASGVVENVNQIVLGGGGDGSAPAANDLIGSVNLKTGVQALRDVDLFNILCLPGAAELSSGMVSVYESAVKLCEDERAFLIVDIDPDTNDVPDAKTWLGDVGITSNHAAVYFPRVQIADPLDDFRLRSFGASGTMAGVYARTDSDRGVWKAPAGIDADIRGVRSFDYTLTDAENGSLNPLGINCLRGFPVYGRLAWGARTLEGADALASEWKYVPVRRLALFIEETLFRGSKWAVFEPNDEPLWSQIRLNVGAFMHDLFRQGAFQGTTPRDAYLVKCDSETTTQNDIDKGIVNILVGFAPLKPAEFVIIQIQQLAGQIQT